MGCNQNNIFKLVLTTLGPGLLFSGAAIGVSHLVMSTRAGATYGLCMLFFVVLANFLKYPFFQFGPLYASATGRDLLDGYASIGQTALALFTLFTIVTFFIFIAAVTIVTAGLALVLFNIDISEWQCSLCILIFCAGVLICGHYHYLERFVKLIIIILTLTTLIAFITAFYNKLGTGFSVPSDFVAPSLLTDVGLSFLIALMGWMPAPIELSVWHSIWQLEKKKNEPRAVSVAGALLDFNVGYIGTVLIALMFVCLGSFILYGSNQEFPSSAVGFSNMLINLYTEALGGWVWWIICIAGFTTMFSTTITLLDAYARVLAKCFSLLFKNKFINNNKNYNVWLIISIFGTLFVLDKFINNMKLLTSFATILSFLTAPLFALLNYKVITSSNMPREYAISSLNKLLSYLGLGFLLVVSILYVIIVMIC